MNVALGFSLTGSLLLCAFVSCGEASMHPQLTAFVSPVPARSSSAPCLPRLAPSYTERNARRCETALNMGLRSFLKKKVLRRKDDDENEDEVEGDLEPWMTAGTEEVSEEDVEEDVEDVAPPSRRSQVEKREFERMDRIRDPGEETVQERLNRLKAGRLTDEEKMAFLETTLSASSTGIRMNKGGKPLRQKIPSPDDPEIKKSASPYPTDSALKNTFARVQGRGNANRKSALPITELDSDRKKREYLEMVTNPNRFKSYVATRTTNEPPAPLDSFTSDDEDMDSSPEDVNATDASSAPPPVGSPGLASRLEAAASAEEIRKKDMKKQQEEAKQQQLQKLAEMQRMRNEEIAKRETEALERKKQQEEAQRRIEEERLIVEEERQRQMMEAQDAYWKRKLEEERAKQRQALSAEEKAQSVQKTAQEIERERKQERDRLREEERQREDPHEGEILKEAEEKKLHDREATWEVTEKAAAQIKGTEPLKDVPDVSLNSFLSQQAKQKAEINERKDAQLEQLKSLNSPLPSPQDKSSPPSATPIMQQGRQIPPQTGSRRVSSIADFSLGANKARAAAASRQLTSPNEKPPKKEKSIQEAMADLDEEEEEDYVKEEEPKKSGGGGLGGLTRMLMGNKKESKEPKPSDAKDVVEAAGNDPVSDARPKKPLRQPLPDPDKKKKVVRQQLPIVDEDDDFDDFARDGPNTGMSIADAMEKSGGVSRMDEDPMERSKRWGIDLSKFD